MKSTFILLAIAWIAHASYPHQNATYNGFIYLTTLSIGSQILNVSVDIDMQFNVNNYIVHIHCGNQL
jgi:hypothetical protein